MKKIIYGILTLALLFSTKTGLAYQVPEDDSGAKYFYVFGPKGNPELGAEVSHQELYVDVPKSANGDVRIAIFDADTGGDRDLKPGVDNQWDTITEFSVYGRDDAQLGMQSFGMSKEYDAGYFEFGPYSKEQGVDVGDAYRFKIVAQAVSGDDENIYNIKISPEQSEAFTYHLMIRLVEKEGAKMYFYPQVSAGTAKITMKNYDMDPDGGISRLFNPQTGAMYKIKDSGSGKWADTEVMLNTDKAYRLEYVITKKTQRHGNAGLTVVDDKGEHLPVYFSKNSRKLTAVPVMPEEQEAPADRKSVV